MMLVSPDRLNQIDLTSDQDSTIRAHILEQLEHLVNYFGAFPTFCEIALPIVDRIADGEEYNRKKAFRAVSQVFTDMVDAGALDVMHDLDDGPNTYAPAGCGVYRSFY